MNPQKKMKNIFKIVFTIFIMLIILFFAICLIGKFVMDSDEGEVIYLVFRNVGFAFLAITIFFAIFYNLVFKKHLEKSIHTLELQIKNLNNSIKILRLQIRAIQIEIGSSDLIEEDFEEYTDIMEANAEMIRLSNLLQEYQILQLKSKEVEDK